MSTFQKELHEMMQLRLHQQIAIKAHDEPESMQITNLIQTYAILMPKKLTFNYHG